MYSNWEFDPDLEPISENSGNNSLIPAEQVADL